MTIWIIEPRDPLIVRDGRPFDPTPGAQAISLPFPFPSTTTGGARTRAGLNEQGIFPYSQGSKELAELKKLKVRGPLLVELSSENNDVEQEEWLAPAPLDALLLSVEQTDGADTFMLKRLVPLKRPANALTDFDQHNPDDLTLVGPVQTDMNKPAPDAPHYWYWDTFQAWLLHPPDEERHIDSPWSLGIRGPQHEKRIHVSIDMGTQVAREGALFATSGLEFIQTGKSHEKRLSETQRLALAIDVEENEQFQIQEGLASLGGERRIVRWRKGKTDLPPLPEEIERKIISNRHKGCRIVLLTPAYFEQGYRPEWLLKKQFGVTPHLEAIAIQRPQVVSGWDLEHRRPKQSRRLAPAGSVFFLKLEGNDDEVRNWMRNIWMQCISDDEQSRNDGFGLAVLGTWAGERVAMQEGK